MARILFFLSLCLFAGLSTAIDDKCNKHTATTQIFPNARIDQIVWCKPDYQVAFLTLSDQTLYRTEDTGKTWTKIPRVAARSVTATADDSKYFFLDSNGTLSVTTDKGKTVTTTQNRDLADIEPHPSRADWALASRRVCNNPNGFWSCHTNLLVTQDFGATWTFVNGNVNQYTWGNAGKTGISDTNIHFVWYPYSNDTDDESEFGTYARSPDLGKTVTHSIPNCVGILHTPEYFFVAQDIGNDLVLMTSDSNANTFQTARFPQVIELNLKQTRYSILDTTGGAAFINVDHSTDGRWGHTYVADSFSDPSFVVSMKYTKRSPSGRVDFARVKGVDGVYIANKWLVDDADRSIKPETLLQTFITFNSGATWQRLTVPKGSGCTDCPLSLVGRANVYNIPSFYTSARAVGLVIAAGSVEDSIDDVLPDELQTFFSRDAGQNWELIKNGTHLYHFLDHGSIIVLLDSQTKTNTYSYTWNEGITWHDCVLSSATFDVKSIQSAPTGTALSLLVVGELENANGRRNGVLVHLDFSDLHSTVCGPNDYETFSPHGDQCLLGQKFTYKRRQRAKECFNGDAYEASSAPEACPCTEADYECEFCFERSANGSCVLQPVSLCQRLKNQPCHTGYRLAPRNKCNPEAPKAVNHLPPKSCTPNTNPQSKSGGSRVAVIVVIMVLLAIVGILIGGTLYLRKTNDNFRDKTDAFFEKISSIFKKPTGRVAHYSAVNKHEGDDLLDDEDVDGPKELDDDAISRYTNKKPTATQPKSGERDEFI